MEKKKSMEDLGPQCNQIPCFSPQTGSQDLVPPAERRALPPCRQNGAAPPGGPRGAHPAPQHHHRHQVLPPNLAGFAPNLGGKCFVLGCFGLFWVVLGCFGLFFLGSPVIIGRMAALPHNPPSTVLIASLPSLLHPYYTATPSLLNPYCAPAPFLAPSFLHLYSTLTPLLLCFSCHHYCAHSQPMLHPYPILTPLLLHSVITLNPS